MRWLLLIICLLSPVAAQPGFPADPCPLGTAEAVLEGADVRAALFNNGNLFFGGTTTNGDGYQTPLTGPDAGNRVVLVSQLWLGARLNDVPRANASRYSFFAYRPGLAGPDGTPPTPAECADADRIWIVSRDDVAAYLRDGTLTDDLRDWPVALGAPVLDGDGIAGNYDLAAGDEPAIRGDVTAFWAMTDLARDGVGNGPPVGVDVAVEAFAFRAPPFAPSPASPLASATAYRYTVTNRSGVSLDSLHAGLFLQWELGKSFVASDTARHLALVYRPAPDSSPTGWSVPPAFGAVVVASPDGPDGSPLGMTAMPSYDQGGGRPPSADPLTADEVLHSLSGRWLDGTPIREYGLGYGAPTTAPVTRFRYAGDPVSGAFWSERNTDGNGTAHFASQRRSMMSSGPVMLAPDASASWTFALVFAQGSDNNDSIVRLRGRAEQMHALQAAGVFEPTRVGRLPTPPPPSPLVVRRPAPNPFAGTTALTLRGLAGEAVTLTVTDVLGRVVERRDVTPVADDVDVSLGAGLAPGVYVVRVAGRGFDLGFPVVKTR